MKSRKKAVWTGAALLLVFAAVGVVYMVRHDTPKNAGKQDSSSYASKPVTQTEPPAPTGFDKKQQSIDDSASLWAVVNKLRPLKTGYVPAGLAAPAVALRLSASSAEMKMRPESGAALKEMFTDAKAAGSNLLIASAYRSEATQKALHASYVAQKGEAAADTDSARAGYSEHQTGLAVDVGRTDHACEVDPCFAATAEGQWVAKNAYKYGFIVRYPENKQANTGYVYEPWHLRYVGKDLAKAIYDSGQTMEEFFDLPAAPDYK
jgi:zinc D-Ala-D-Ala carboxypeptidase